MKFGKGFALIAAIVLFAAQSQAQVCKRLQTTAAAKALAHEALGDPTIDGFARRNDVIIHKYVMLACKNGLTDEGVIQNFIRDIKRGPVVSKVAELRERYEVQFIDAWTAIDQGVQSDCIGTLARTVAVKLLDNQFIADAFAPTAIPPELGRDVQQTCRSLKKNYDRKTAVEAASTEPVTLLLLRASEDNHVLVPVLIAAIIEHQFAAKKTANQN